MSGGGGVRSGSTDRCRCLRERRTARTTRELLVVDELGVRERTHLGQVHAHELLLGRRPDAALHERVLELEERVRDAEDDGPDHDGADELAQELSPTTAVVQEPDDASRRAGPLRAVPALAVLTV